jgi:hypothetical protein
MTTMALTASLRYREVVGAISYPGSHELSSTRYALGSRSGLGKREVLVVLS